MLNSELKIGMKVRANERSNGRYGVTRQSDNCEGIVKGINSGGTFTLKITKHDSVCELGNTYTVAPEYFDKVEETGIIAVELKEEVKQEFELNVGDLVVTEEGNLILVLNEEPGFRGIVLNKERVTVYKSDIADLKNHIEANFGKIKKVVPATKLKITEI